MYASLSQVHGEGRTIQILHHGRRTSSKRFAWGGGGDTLGPNVGCDPKPKNIFWGIGPFEMGWDSNRGYPKVIGADSLLYQVLGWGGNIVPEQGSEPESLARKEWHRS